MLTRLEAVRRRGGLPAPSYAERRRLPRRQQPGKSFVATPAPGDVGPAHETTPKAAQLLFADDSRRDGVLLWLAGHAEPLRRMTG